GARDVRGADRARAWLRAGRPGRAAVLDARERRRAHADDLRGGSMSAGTLAPRSPFVRIGARERQRAATRERLFEAALAEFRGRGFERASVARIARAARVSRPSFYAHFPTLDHVLFELAWRLSLRIVRALEGAAGLRETLDRLADGLI